MKRTFNTALYLCALLCLILTFSALPAAAQIPEKANKDFHQFLDKLAAEGVIATADGDATYYGDYENEWAQINWYQWINFENSNRFVLSANVSWASASQTPNNFASGCGVIFNAGSGSDSYLLASIRMDGLLYINGARNRQDVSYGTYRYGSASTKGSTDFVMVVDNGKASFYMDGQRIVRKAELLVMGDNVGLATLSGTNKDFGTRCTWKDIFFYTW